MIFSIYAFFLGLALSLSLFSYFNLKDFFVNINFSPSLRMATWIYLLLNILAAHLGAKLFFFFSQLLFFHKNILNLEFFLIGGGVIWGSLISVYILNLIFLKCSLINKIQFCLTVICLCFGQAVGRFACFFSGCCYGRFQVQLWESFYTFSLAVLFIYLLKKKRMLAFYIPELHLTFYSLGRFFLEYLREDDLRGVIVIFEKVSLSFSQMISLSVMLIQSFILIRKGKFYYENIYKNW